MRTPTEGICRRPVVTRQFEFSRNQRMNLAAAFEHVLPIIIVRGPAQDAASCRDTVDARHQRRVIS